MPTVLFLPVQLWVYFSSSVHFSSPQVWQPSFSCHPSVLLPLLLSFLRSLQRCFRCLRHPPGLKHQSLYHLLCFRIPKIKMDQVILVVKFLNLLNYLVIVNTPLCCSRFEPRYYHSWDIQNHYLNEGLKPGLINTNARRFSLWKLELSMTNSKVIIWYPTVKVSTPQLGNILKQMIHNY